MCLCISFQVIGIIVSQNTSSVMVILERENHKEVKMRLVCVLYKVVF